MKVEHRGVDAKRPGDDVRAVGVWLRGLGVIDRVDDAYFIKESGGVPVGREISGSWVLNGVEPFCRVGVVVEPSGS